MASRGVYGAPRIHAELRMEHDIRIGQKAGRAVDESRWYRGRQAPQAVPRRRSASWGSPQPVTSSSGSSHQTSPNVLWVADITYLRTGEGWLYLAAVQDAYSRQIVGWSMTTHMRASLVVDALKMALARWRLPRLG